MLNGVQAEFWEISLHSAEPDFENLEATESLGCKRVLFPDSWWEEEDGLVFNRTTIRIPCVFGPSTVSHVCILKDGKGVVKQSFDNPVSLYAGDLLQIERGHLAFPGTTTVDTGPKYTSVCPCGIFPADCTYHRS